MYTWIWRALPGGLPGKLLGSVLLLTGAVALLFFVVFPRIEPLVPIGEVTIEREDGEPVRSPESDPTP